MKRYFCRWWIIFIVILRRNRGSQSHFLTSTVSEISVQEYGFLSIRNIRQFDIFVMYKVWKKCWRQRKERFQYLAAGYKNGMDGMWFYGFHGLENEKTNIRFFNLDLYQVCGLPPVRPQVTNTKVVELGEKGIKTSISKGSAYYNRKTTYISLSTLRFRTVDCLVKRIFSLVEQHVCYMSWCSASRNAGMLATDGRQIGIDVKYILARSSSALVR